MNVQKSEEDMSIKKYEEEKSIMKGNKMKKILLQVIIVFVFYGTAFGVDSNVSWIPGDELQDFSRIPKIPTTNDIISFVIPTDVFDNQWQAEQALGGVPTLMIDSQSKTIILIFKPPLVPGPPQTEYDPVSGLEGYFGPLEEGSWLFFAQFPGTIYIDDFEVIFAPPITVDHFLTEQFEGDGDNFDLMNQSITFVPTPGNKSYIPEIQQILQLPTDPEGGVDLGLTDDDSRFVKLGRLVTVSIYGNSFNSFYVSSNGYITFTEGDHEYADTLPNHFDLLRVSGLFRDLNPSSGGQVSFKYIQDGVAVTWEQVPEYNNDNSNTFQIELFNDGRIRMSWLGVDSEGGIVGLSDGTGVPPDFQEIDFSELSTKPPTVPPLTDDYLTEEFSVEDIFDLQYSSVMFTPTADGTSYTGLLQDIEQLPTNPIGGTDLGLEDDDFVLVVLSNQTRVKIFNQSFRRFFVGVNGYITFTEGDTDFSQTLEEHFEILRISGLYYDLTARNEGTITVKKLFNRIAVTWQEVPGFSNTSPNTFQIEMFYDGRIRLSWLEIGSPENIVGLSNGLGLSPDFEETDFSVDYAQP
ncbi:MAG: hypothetical protein ACYS3S_04100 [Planctomycetota bacterium]|jgi:hypothetical protein